MLDQLYYLRQRRESPAPQNSWYVRSSLIILRGIIDSVTCVIQLLVGMRVLLLLVLLLKLLLQLLGSSSSILGSDFSLASNSSSSKLISINYKELGISTAIWTHMRGQQKAKTIKSCGYKRVHYETLKKDPTCGPSSQHVIGICALR